MDGRKLTVTKTHAGSHPWFVIREAEDDVMVARFETEADAHLFVQADALKRDNARMVEALEDIARQRSCGDPDANRRELIFAIEHARAVLAQLEGEN